MAGGKSGKRLARAQKWSMDNFLLFSYVKQMISILWKWIYAWLNVYIRISSLQMLEIKKPITSLILLGDDISRLRIVNARVARIKLCMLKIIEDSSPY